MLKPENGGKLGETLEIREWRRRLKSLLGDEEEGERTEGAVGREGENVRVRRENVKLRRENVLGRRENMMGRREREEVRVRREEPVYSSDHRIAWLCGDPSK